MLGDSGPLQITGGKLEVMADGLLRSEGEEVGKLKIVRFADPRQAVKEGTNLFSAVPTNVREASEVRVMQGGLEQSNVSPIDSMVSMIAIQRQFEAYERAMKLMDSVTEKMIADAAN